MNLTYHKINKLNKMGSSSTRRSNEPEYLKDLLQSSQNALKKYNDEKNETIDNIKKEIEKYLISKDINSSKEKMKKILREEDDIIIYDILNRILKTLFEKTASLSESKECPIELRPPLNTVIYSAPKLKIKELSEFRDIFKEKYGKNYIKNVDNDEDHLVNEVLIEKLKDNNYSDQLINMRLKLICQDKNINSQFLDSLNNQAPSEINNSSRLRTVNTIRSSSRISFYNKSDIQTGEIKEIEKSKKNEESQNKEEDKNLVDNSDKYSDEFEKIAKNDPFKRTKTFDDPIQEGENLFLPYDEKIDEECYNINKIDNWADIFYNLKTGIILERYKELLSKSEFSKFFEALNYEYGINNYPLDLQKAFDIYKNAADSTTDTLSMYRLYHIYKKDYKKFNLEKRSHVLEKFYIMKCFTYLTSFEKYNRLFRRFEIGKEIGSLLMNKNNIFYSWYIRYFDFLMENYSYYNINKDDIILIEVVTYYFFEKKESNKTLIMDNKIIDLIKKTNPHAMYNLASFYDTEDYSKIYEQLYKMNYYRSFDIYAKIKANEDKDKALNMLKTSISNGYIGHIKDYYEIFMLDNEIEDIVKSPSLKSELLFIITYFLDNIILDDIELLFNVIHMRNVLIMHYNFEKEFKNNIDTYLKEIVNYLNNFMKGNYDENKKKIKSFLIPDYFSLLYSLYGNICYLGVKGIIDKNYNETLNTYKSLLKNDDCIFLDRFYLYYIYMIKNKQRKLNEENNKTEEKDLIELEKKLLNLFYEDLSVEKIKKNPPSYFYYLSKLFRNNTIKTKDLILEYIFLNRAANAKIIELLPNVRLQLFEEKYLIFKAKKKIKEKNNEENFKKIKEGKGAINVEGYGEDGMICPICLENKKSIIALPCKHFFCSSCMNRLLEDRNCPICRTEIKITFDINSKKETLIKSKVIPYSHDPFYDPELDPFNNYEFDPFNDPELDPPEFDAPFDDLSAD